MLADRADDRPREQEYVDGSHRQPDDPTGPHSELSVLDVREPACNQLLVDENRDDDRRNRGYFGENAKQKSADPAGLLDFHSGIVRSGRGVVQWAKYPTLLSAGKKPDQGLSFGIRVSVRWRIPG